VPEQWLLGAFWKEVRENVMASIFSPAARAMTGTKIKNKKNQLSI
jgi:hypothetical protein